MNQKPTSYVLAALGFLPAFAFAVTPILTSVLGTVRQGLTVTITGTSMVQEDRTNWDPFFKTNHPNASGFEGTSPAADGYDTPRTPPDLTYDSSVKLMGSQSIKMHDSGSHTWIQGGASGGNVRWAWQVQGALGTGPGDVYLRTYSRWNYNSWPNQEIKYWWLVGDGINHWLFFNLRPNADHSAPTGVGYYSSGVPGGFTYHNFPQGALQNNRWYLFEFHFRRFGFPPYVLEAWVDNKLVFSVSATDGPNGSGTSLWESNTNYWDTLSNWDGTQWQDAFTVGSARIGPASLIEIGNSLTYNPNNVV